MQQPVASTSRTSASGSRSASASSVETSTVTTPTLSSTNGKERAMDVSTDPAVLEFGSRMSGLNHQSASATESGADGHAGQARNGQLGISSDPAGEGRTEGNEKALLEHLYTRGFINGEYCDVQLHFRPDRQPLKVHSLILALSPALVPLLQHPHAPQQPPDVFLPLNDHDEISDEAMYVAVGYLYSSRSLGMINASNAPGVLSAALLLQLPELAYYAASICKDSIDSIVSPQQVRYWFAFLEGVESRQSRGIQTQSYWTDFKDALTHRLQISLPLSLHAFTVGTPAPQQAEAQTILQHIYSILPFDAFKSILESPLLGSSQGESLSDQSRFSLAKKCVAERKKLANAAGQADFEETVVLAFGGATGASNVNIVRKPKQNRKLWKASG